MLPQHHPNLITHFRHCQGDKPINKKTFSFAIRKQQYQIMSKKYSTIRQPSHYKLGLDCLHQPVLSLEVIRNAKVESQFNGKSYDDMIVCPQCARHERGSCDQYKIIHKVITATPLYGRQLTSFEQPQPQEQQQQQE